MRQNQTMELGVVTVIKVPGLEKGDSHTYMNFEANGQFACSPSERDLRELAKWCLETADSMKRWKRRKTR